MDTQNNQQNVGSLGFFFPQPDRLSPPTKQDLEGIKFRGKRLDLEVYHLAYGTKKLRACTYRRMQRRQKLKNKRKAEALIPKSAEQKQIKANKQGWLREVQGVVDKQNLKAVQLPAVRVRVQRRVKGANKGAGKKKRKHIRKIKAKIQASKETEMKD